ncbi:MAG: peptidoglycan bridge formation glycyltransferase FemA/FemB family protein [bacterium]
MINAQHPLQSSEWGEFRKLTGIKVVREDDLQITIHQIPYTPWNIGYAPKGPMPDERQAQILARVAKENHCLFIKCEPKIEITNHKFSNSQMRKWGFVSGRPMFTKYNFVLDVTPKEEELLASFKQKTRYNIKVAEKKGVSVEIDDSSEAFERYLQLTQETTKRQGFYAHGKEYQEKMWKVLHTAGIAHLLVARYEGQIITTWILFKFGDTLYYPYGASTREHREVMANNLVMWEAIKLAKKWNCVYLDMWGALGPDADPNDPWYGFHTFKSGYGARHVEYIGTWDYVAMPALYKIYRIVENLRWKLLRILKS